MSSNSFEQNLQMLAEKLKEAHAELKTTLEEAQAEHEKIQKAVGLIHKSWSGSWIGYHAKLYFQNFETPPWNMTFDPEWGGIYGIPKTWREQTIESISAEIQSRSEGASLQKLECFAKRINDVLKPLHTDVCISLSPIHDRVEFERESVLLDEIEKLEWQISPSKFSEQYKPSSVATRNSHAIYQGIQVPPHIQYLNKELSAFSTIQAAKLFFEKSDHLLRQIQQKLPRKEAVMKLNNVFIIHGHDDKAKLELQHFLRDRFHLNPIILEEQPSKGSMTIIEKLEHYAQQCFCAFAILTPDDKVIPSKELKNMKPEEKRRARQNVILEIGYFYGLLGRNKVFLLYKEGDTEIPSDLYGIIYIPFQYSIQEVTEKIRQELESFGLI